jgi:hypothetical protein
MDDRDRRAPGRLQESIAGLTRWAFAINLLGTSDADIVRAVLNALDQIDQRIDPLKRGRALSLSVNWQERVRQRLKDGQITDEARRGAHVRWLETLLSPESAVDFRPTNDTSVEHVLPRSATGQWRTDFPEAINVWTEMFGNLCLVPKEVNSRVGNDQFAAKKEALAALEPYFRSAHDVAKTKAWTMAAVRDRNDRLERVALRGLGL